MAEYNIVGYETLTIAASAVSLTGATTGESFVGRLETGQIRARGDGTDPTSSEGVLINPGDTVIMSGSEIDNTAFIRTGSSSGVLKGHFYSTHGSTFSGGGV